MVTDPDRIDQLHTRVDGLYSIIQDGFADARGDMRELRISVNHRVHAVESQVDEMRTQVLSLQKPWKLLNAALAGWRKAAALATAVGGVVAWATKAGFWPL